jgi:hypothetical protein
VGDVGALFVEALRAACERRRHAAHARGEHVELGGDVLGGHGGLSWVGAVTYAEFPSGVA